MRNWNLGQGCRYRPGLRFQTTYEELKPSLLLPIKHQYPCFQTTYEELKPEVQIGNDTISGFQTTYEELKLEIEIAYPCMQAIIRFQTTYEELKPGYDEPSGDIVVASRLPMRNWNSGSGWWHSVWARRLPDYLWGIETRRAGFDGSSGQHASRLPMRNWNLSFHYPARLCRASRLPMRNWNCRNQRNWILRIPLPDYLWGIETVVAFRIRATIRLPDYLWGIETRNDSIGCVEERTKLPDYLWGIETRACSCGCRSFQRFQTTYEELKPLKLFYELVCLDGFQTTYEELKHGNCIAIKLELIASRLPMRNWNAYGHTSKFRITASRLPMRNWN